MWESWFNGQLKKPPKCLTCLAANTSPTSYHVTWATAVYPQTTNEKLIELQFSQKKNTPQVDSQISSFLLLVGLFERNSHEGSNINDVTQFLTTIIPLSTPITVIPKSAPRTTGGQQENLKRSMNPCTVKLGYNEHCYNEFTVTTNKI